MTDRLIGSKLGQYHLIELINRGGMAAVYKARQPSLFDRIVAIKVMDNPDFADRFKLEGLVSAHLQHPHILPIIDSGEQDGLLYIVWQYVENGTTLNDKMGSPIAPVEALSLIIHVLDALEYAHQRGIIHRDVKPANVLLSSLHGPLLADFGIARDLKNTGPRHTKAGFVVGTPTYSAPEQLGGNDVDARTDIYSIGVVLYEMLAGKVPFDADTPLAVWHQHKYQAPQPPSQLNQDIPPIVEAVVLRALEKEPAKRYQTAAEMKTALERVVIQLQQTDKRTRVTGLYESGMQALELGELEQAITHFRTLIELDPDNKEGAELLAEVEAEAQKAHEEARQKADAIRKRHSSIQPQSRPPTPQPMVGPTVVNQVEPHLPTPEPSVGATVANQPALPTPRTSETVRFQTPQPSEGPTRAPEPTPDPTGSVRPAGLAAQPVPRVTTPLPAPTPAVQGKKTHWWLIGGGLVAIVALVGLLWSIGIIPPIGAPTPVPTTAPAPTGAATAAPTTAPKPTSAPSAPTAAPEATTIVPLPAPVGSLVFEDDFLDQGVQSGLEDLVNNPIFQRGYHPDDGGVYHLRLLNSADTRAVFLPRTTYRNFSIQAEMWDFSDDTRTGAVGQGIVFRVRDPGRYYAFLVNPRAGQYSVRKLEGPDQASDLIAWKDSAVVRRNNEHNFVRIDGVGNTFTIYLNDTLVETFTDDTYASGMLGMIVSNQDAIQPHMHFDKLQIWSDDQLPGSERPATLSTETGDMSLIVGGEFVMGANEDADGQPNVVDVPDFYIDRTEVTNDMYAQCVEAGACTIQQSPSSQTHPTYSTEAQYGSYPAIHISWQQANAYCAWAGKRLPSEAEWEKAASWSSETHKKTIWPWGNAFDQKQVNSIDANLRDTTTVASFPPAANGLYDMAGNVSEWTNSAYTPYPYNATDGREDSETVGARVYRGGSWGQSGGKLRSSFRQSSTPDRGDREIGFRCAVSPAT